jgi:hypothetical protein
MMGTVAAKRFAVHFFVIGEQRRSQRCAAGPDEGEISLAGTHGHHAKDAAKESQRQTDDDKHQKPAEQSPTMYYFPHGCAALAVAP